MTASPADLSTQVTQVADGLCAYLDASPSPFHAVGTAVAELAPDHEVPAPQMVLPLNG